MTTEPCIVFLWDFRYDRNCPRQDFRFDSQDDAVAFLEGRGMSRQLQHSWLGKGSYASLFTASEWENRPGVTRQ